MAKRDWIWMGRPAHFICADRCHYRLATYIPKSNMIVSTVGDMEQDGKRPVSIGCDRTYETFVFRAREEAGCDGCPYHAITSGGEIDSLPANSANEAYANHMELCAKWDKKSAPTTEENPR